MILHAQVESARKTRNVILYSILPGEKDESVLGQHLRSLHSLRRKNPDIPVRVASWGKRLNPAARKELRRLKAEEIPMGSYERTLKRHLPSRWAQAISKFPLPSKWLAVAGFSRRSFERLLYVDNDTFFFKDPSILFRRCAGSGLYAREEIFSRRSPLGHDPAYIDEEALGGLGPAGSKAVIPFNTGVVLMDREVTRWLSRNISPFLAHLTRFTIWLASRPPAPDDQPFVQWARECGLHEARGVGKPAPYPSSNPWIAEQVSLWLTLAASPYQARILPQTLVKQGAEYETVGNPRELPLLFHYYSANSAQFQSWLFEFKLRFPTAL